MYQHEPCKIASIMGNPKLTCKDVHQWILTNKKSSEEPIANQLEQKKGSKKAKHSNKKRKVQQVQLYNILKSKLPS